jgi:hypothetical protein
VDASISANDTITLGNGAGDEVAATNSANATITLGDGPGDEVQVGSSSGIVRVTVGNGDNDQVVLFTETGPTFGFVAMGNGNNDILFSTGGNGNFIGVGNGNDTIHVGTNDTVHVGKGQDILAFDWNPNNPVFPLFLGPDQSKPFGIGFVDIFGFDPGKDVLVFQKALASTFNVTDDPGGSANVTFNGGADRIVLTGVHSSALHASDFNFV